ncbi:XRE family transcriptional regulator [Crossiella sp. SN42]|uniref:helix-turn-helix domain-containing protein n=1 Tax=Crossiella sp. SN42 TaxID=2944808 RepID=UPI00207D2DBF|nr:XRE family transcriptional regulator [Crossiella sp. SN42]MCO1577695.1 XRE family transcriptional regulator [Crossiella sp. SN42]
MSEDWAAVAKAIDERIEQLGVLQRAVAERAHVSQAIIRELQYNTVQRRRSARTLEALSAALEWDPQHLSRVLHGGKLPPTAEQQVSDRLSAIEDRLSEIVDRLDEINANLTARGEADDRPG